MKQEQYQIRKMEMDDYDEVYALWGKIHGFAIRSIDDSREGIERFLKRNPTTSVVAVEEGHVVGAILCGHDGRSACFYHVCVDEAYRKRGIGEAMVRHCLVALKEEKINKVNLMAFKNNELGNEFWQGLDWKIREDINYYEAVLNQNNISTVNP